MINVLLLSLFEKKLKIIRVQTCNSIRIALNNSRLDVLGPLITVHIICSLTTNMDLL